ncbi:MAG: methionine synthase [Deltaproteobacteria bacterium]|nr:methionine synthase [Deltaproteobacteria bacterium]
MTHEPRLRPSDLRDLLQSRIIVFDGAMGTQLQARKLVASDFGGEQYVGCNEHLVLTRPDVIADVHRAYFAAGADFVETDSFGGTPFVLDEYGLGAKALEINTAAARIARAVSNEFTDKPRFVAGSMGPTTRSLSVTGGITFDVLVDHYAVQAEGLLSGGADILLLETSLDTLNVKAGLAGIERAEQKLGVVVPVMLSCTIEQTGTMLAGQGAEAFAVSVEHAARRKGGLVSIGVNCATGPDPMADHVRALSALSPFSISCMPNAGLPDEDGKYGETPASLAKKLGRFCEHGFLNVVGGCCGTTPAHIAAIAQMAASLKPRSPPASKRALVSGVDFLDLDETRPIIVGERTNVIGSRAFKRLIVESKWEEAAEIGRKQVRGGAHIIDVCLANPDRDEQADVIAFLEQLTKKVKAPLMIDSTDAVVLEEALKRCQGKAIVNSVNLEDGRERFDAVVPLLHRYGAAVVVGTIDEDPVQGMAVTRARKLRIAERSHALLTGEYGLADEDIIFDPLVFPCGTGDQQYIGSATETIEGVRLIKQRFPRCRTILGISNVSFGLPDAGREALNTVFLHKNFEAGLDLAIVNAEKLERITHLDADTIAVCERLLAAAKDGYDAALAAFTEHFRGRQKKAAVGRDLSLPVTDRLKKAILEGSKEGLIEDLEELRPAIAPLDIINGPLMEGMAEVGRLFGANQLIVAEVLQSAEVMKAAVAHLEQFMAVSAGAAKAKMLLATVKGDVHDIGKNLVDIILSNNGYEVVNLGIKVPPGEIIKAVREHAPGFIGLSGLLVKSAQEMVSTAEELREAGIDIPILVGGAALTERFTYGRIARAYAGPGRQATVAYARDAMTGLDLANRLFDDDKRPVLLTHIAERMAAAADPVVSSSTASPALPPLPAPVAVVVRHDAEPPRPPDTKLHVLDDVDLETLWSYVNPMMLYTRHLGLKGRVDDLVAAGDARAIELKRVVRDLESEVLAQGLLRARCLWRFFRAASDGDALVLLDAVDGIERAVARFAFPRQAAGERRCLADLVPPSTATLRDHVALFVTTCQGRRDSVRALADACKARGEFLKMHALQALAIETAEAAAEWLHERLRQAWGVGDPPSVTKQDLFSARYRGRRYSFGYPACPNLEDQAVLWQLLDPGTHVGVELTDGFMMEPEASVSALVFHHGQATYFDARGRDA